MMLSQKFFIKIIQPLMALHKACLLKKTNFHSIPKSINLAKMKVVTIPAFKDNYMYLLFDEETGEAAAVDPADPDIIVNIVKDLNLKLTTILTTHHHCDHDGGNKKIVQMISGLEVVGGSNKIRALTKIVKHGDELKVGNLRIQCLYTPCHTDDHICYYVQAPNDVPVVFTGDTLFTAGCGAFFEGTPEQMYVALIEILGSLPDETKVFCGHEYTLKNLTFAKYVEPDNKYIDYRFNWAKQLRDKKKATVPSTIGEEKLSNPFMRVNEISVQNHAGQCNPISTLGYIRTQKNDFF